MRNKKPTELLRNKFFCFPAKTQRNVAQRILRIIRYRLGGFCDFRQRGRTWLKGERRRAARFPAEA